MVETLESAELEAQRAGLQALLGSKEFARAPALANLPSHLCDRLFAGEANLVKEYPVGAEVFKCGTWFDRESGSIVRVEANRLRKRLDAYYADECATHRCVQFESDPMLRSSKQKTSKKRAAHNFP